LKEATSIKYKQAERMPLNKAGLYQLYPACQFCLSFLSDYQAEKL
jgi:hypothetical protein